MNTVLGALSGLSLVLLLGRAGRSFSPAVFASAPRAEAPAAAWSWGPIKEQPWAVDTDAEMSFWSDDEVRPVAGSGEKGDGGGWVKTPAGWLSGGHGIGRQIATDLAAAAAAADARNGSALSVAHYGSEDGAFSVDLASAAVGRGSVMSFGFLGYDQMHLHDARLAHAGIRNNLVMHPTLRLHRHRIDSVYHVVPERWAVDPSDPERGAVSTRMLIAECYGRIRTLHRLRPKDNINAIVAGCRRDMERVFGVRDAAWVHASHFPTEPLFMETLYRTPEFFERQVWNHLGVAARNASLLEPGCEACIMVGSALAMGEVTYLLVPLAFTPEWMAACAAERGANVTLSRFGGGGGGKGAAAVAGRHIRVGECTVTAWRAELVGLRRQVRRFVKVWCEYTLIFRGGELWFTKDNSVCMGYENALHRRHNGGTSLTTATRLNLSPLSRLLLAAMVAEHAGDEFDDVQSSTDNLLCCHLGTLTPTDNAFEPHRAQCLSVSGPYPSSNSNLNPSLARVPHGGDPPTYVPRVFGTLAGGINATRPSPDLFDWQAPHGRQNDRMFALDRFMSLVEQVHGCDDGWLPSPVPQFHPHMFDSDDERYCAGGVLGSTMLAARLCLARRLAALALSSLWRRDHTGADRTGLLRQAGFRNIELMSPPV